MLLFDVESDGLLDTITTIHCLVILNTKSGSMSTYHGGNLREGLRVLAEAPVICGHNIINYDIPAIQKVYPEWTYAGTVVDTLVMSRCIFPDIKNQIDFGLYQEKSYPGKLIGSHSLEAWGHRLGVSKGDYANEMKTKGLDPWAEFNEDMLEYCVQDVTLNFKLYKRLMHENPSRDMLKLEHDVAHILNQQETRGCYFDQPKAAALLGQLVKRQDELKKILVDHFGTWYKPITLFALDDMEKWWAPKRDNAKQGYVAGCPLTKVEHIEFNPNSRQHIAYQLTNMYGWEPDKYTDKNTPIVDEGVLKKSKYPMTDELAEYLMLSKRLAQLSVGKEAWMDLVTDESRIHGRVNTNGAVTGRCTHYRPNLAQVPSIRAPYGRECRELFRATPGMVFVGADASGLELRCLAHYLATWDNGEYANQVVSGDIHTVNQHAAGLPTRDMAKTFISMG